MTRSQGVLEFVLFVAWILKMRFTFDCPKYSSIRDDNKIDNRIPNYKHILISTLIIQLMNSTDYYRNKQLIQYVRSCLEMWGNLVSKAWYCYLMYFLLLLLLLLKCFCNGVSLFYGHANKAHCCCCCCTDIDDTLFFCLSYCSHCCSFNFLKKEGMLPVMRHTLGPCITDQNFIQNQSHSVYKSCAFASLGNNC